MHELSLAQNIIDIVREEMQKNHVNTLSSLRLAVGKMSGVVPEALTLCLKIITQDSDLQGITVNMDIIPLRYACPSCKNEFEIDHFTPDCPTCQSPDITIVSGRELSIVEMEVDAKGDTV